MRERERVQHQTGGEKLTQQHMEGVTDINKIMERHLRTGGVPSSGKASGAKPMFIHLTGDSYHEMLIRLQQVQGSFAGLSGKLRKRFANNPENLLRFLEDRKNLREAVSLGIVDEEALTPEDKQQMDLVEASEAEERALFERWRARRRAARSGESDEDLGPFVEDDKANPVPSRPDPESQPSFSTKKRTSRNT